jgi:hypothetical protein
LIAPAQDFILAATWATPPRNIRHVPNLVGLAVLGPPYETTKRVRVRLPGWRCAYHRLMAANPSGWDSAFILPRDHFRISKNAAPEEQSAEFSDLPVWGNSGIATVGCKKCIRLQRAGKDAGARTGQNLGRKLRLPGNRSAKTAGATAEMHHPTRCKFRRAAN